MQKRILTGILLIGFVCLPALFIGCDDDAFIGKTKGNKAPAVWLSSGPVEGDTTDYRVHFYWGGWDPDGEIGWYEHVIVDGDPFGFNPEDTAGVDKWHATTSYDSAFKVSADESPTHVGDFHTRYDKTHTFFVRAIDNQGLRSRPVYRSFTAWTLAPYVEITSPEAGNCIDPLTLSRVITFSWKGKDPIDLPQNIQDPDSIRFLWTEVIDSNGTYDPTFDIVGDLNANPWRYEHLWGPWIGYRTAEGSGRSTILGDDELLERKKHYIFAVQAMDEAGAVTAIFDKCRNVRQFAVIEMAGPLLTVCEPYLGCFRFPWSDFMPVKRDIPAGVPLSFYWYGDASNYGGEIACYRYGWNVADINDPTDWDVPCSPQITTAPERILYSGTHTFFVEAVDNAGTITLASIEINVVPFTMERNLLWIDDFYSTDFNQVLWAIPTETQHDSFWVNICRHASGFDESRDVYDCTANDFHEPDLYEILKYKNIIWTYSSQLTCWADIVYFTPESWIGQGCPQHDNYLPTYLSLGGHLWTLGRSDRDGGLAAMLPREARSFPMSLKCEITGNRDDCEGDTSGVYTMAYRDYCVTMLDKIVGIIRIDDDLPLRRVRDYDAMSFAVRDDTDPITAEYPELPERLDLWEEITRPGRYFDPNGAYDRGLTYVEIYDPAYWMDRNFTTSQSCFHPMYRMKTRSIRSAVNEGVIAIWVTKYEDIIPIAGTGPAARSFHFGFPLWFFDRDQVDGIADVVFDEWQINKY